ncbi:hypothetical protein [Nocardia sp. NPDC059239]|uniref:hypothetical protein n=1 Tax=unclassified Nocardia TaxID=2637762 RepID=UPI0036AA4E45
MTPIRAIIVGLGEHGCAVARLALDAGIEVIAAVDPRWAGTTLTDVLGQAGALEVRVSASIDDIVPILPAADIALLAARVGLDGFIDIARSYAAHGLDVLTISEFLFSRYDLDPKAVAELDEIATRYGVSIVATGIQDVCWVGLVVHASAAVRNLRSILVRQHHGVDGYPREFFDELGIGATPEGFAEAVAGLRTMPSVLGSVLPIIAGELGHEMGRIEREFTPVLATEPLYSKTLDHTFGVGEIIGVREFATLTSDNGFVLSADHSTTARRPDVDATFEAILDADPSITLGHEIVPGPDAVNATVINRIPDVLAAPPGYIQASSLPTPKYRHHLARPETAGIQSS